MRFLALLALGAASAAAEIVDTENEDDLQFLRILSSNNTNTTSTVGPGDGGTPEETSGSGTPEETAGTDDTTSTVAPGEGDTPEETAGTDDTTSTVAPGEGGTPEETSGSGTQEEIDEIVGDFTEFAPTADQVLDPEDSLADNGVGGSSAVQTELALDITLTEAEAADAVIRGAMEQIATCANADAQHRLVRDTIAVGLQSADTADAGRRALRKKSARMDRVLKAAKKKLRAAQKSGNKHTLKKAFAAQRRLEIAITGLLLPKKARAVYKNALRKVYGKKDNLRRLNASDAGNGSDDGGDDDAAADGLTSEGLAVVLALFNGYKCPCKKAAQGIGIEGNTCTSENELGVYTSTVTEATTDARIRRELENSSGRKLQSGVKISVATGGSFGGLSNEAAEKISEDTVEMIADSAADIRTRQENLFKAIQTDGQQLQELLGDDATDAIAAVQNVTPGVQAQEIDTEKFVVADGGGGGATAGAVQTASAGLGLVVIAMLF